MTENIVSHEHGEWRGQRTKPELKTRERGGENDWTVCPRIWRKTEMIEDCSLEKDGRGERLRDDDSRWRNFRWPLIPDLAPNGRVSFAFFDWCVTWVSLERVGIFFSSTALMMTLETDFIHALTNSFVSSKKVVFDASHDSSFPLFLVMVLVRSDCLLNGKRCCWQIMLKNNAPSLICFVH